MTFRAPQLNLYSTDVPRSVAFYERLGFRERFRTPSDGDPIHVELELDGLTVGIASVESARGHHGLAADAGGRGIEIVLWTDDVDAAVRQLGAPVLAAPHDWLDGRLRVAWIEDPDGNPLQLVQRRG